MMIAGLSTMPVEPPSAMTSSMRVVAQLRRVIVDGELAPGTWLRTVVLARRFKVSAQPIREALQHLQGEGLIEILPNRGARVRGLDRLRLIHNSDIGEAMEAMLARRFAENATLADLRALEAIQARHDAALARGSDDDVYDANQEFHDAVNGHRANAEALHLITRYYGLVRLLRSRVGFQPDYRDRVRREHHALVAAFRARDPAAAAEIGALHVRGALEDLLAGLDAMGPTGLRTRA